MSLVLDRDARRSECVSRLRRVIALRAMLAGGSSQREVAALVGLSQPQTSGSREKLTVEIHVFAIW